MYIVYFRPSVRAGRRRGWPLLVGALLGFVLPRLATAGSDAPGSSPPLRVHRTWMPDAYPSSYAIGFPHGLNFCFDPIRANLIYAWQGDYVDLSATVNGKIPRDAVIRGKTFYQCLTPSGFRSGTGQSEAEIRFRAFRIRKDLPEFEYEVDGVSVREAVRPAADGAGLIRTFTVTTPDRRLIYQALDPAKISIDSGPATWTGTSLILPGNSTIVFSLAVPHP